MRKLILFVMVVLGTTLQAQSFDFSCTPSTPTEIQSDAISDLHGEISLFDWNSLQQISFGFVEGESIVNYGDEITAVEAKLAAAKVKIDAFGTIFLENQENHGNLLALYNSGVLAIANVREIYNIETGG